MIQEGLHVGLATWIKSRRAGDDFVVCPSLPVVISSAHLKAATKHEDLARVDEFIRMVNFIPRIFEVAQPFSPQGVLWDVHPSLLQRMDFAARPWSDENEAEWEKAHNVLYSRDTNNQRTLSKAYRIYEEFRKAYEELLEHQPLTGDDLAALSVRWEVEGHRSEIAGAMETILRLSSISWMTRAMKQLAEFNASRIAAGALSGFASTEFSPISAIDVANWTKVEVDLDEIEATVQGSDPTHSWSAWRAVRRGTVRFKYAVLDLTRSWFTPAVYASDDWKLDPPSTVSMNDGSTGELPAFVHSVYLVVLDEIRLEQQPPPTPPRLPDLVTRPIKFPTIPPIRRWERAELIHPLKGFPIGAKTTANSNLQGRTVLARALFQERLAYTRNFVLQDLQSGGSAPLTTQIASFDVVGFGCTKLPSCPVPNSAYTWQ